MKISIYVREDDQIDAIKKMFEEQFQDKTVTWDIDGHIMKSVISANDEVIVELFNKIIEIYPDVDLNGSYSMDIREDDGSANWWSSTSISTERRNGKPSIFVSSETYWN